ncbi:kinase-like domain-containing protein [Aspergillus pseudotamarii]|uniref:Kinase-like domain-containing protein n=1 Tax=Aspergillus pseudotamarii TaxID=132259 RepID=A0A5N6T0E0_ASPPS|nr:kinase-like domain-containing protein [Aspergillus pseudotamarii]KAE8138954.1 kinase-like domain-containing protein [Aspergillus pseudotamarii]
MKAFRVAPSKTVLNSAPSTGLFHGCSLTGRYFHADRHKIHHTLPGVKDTKDDVDALRRLTSGRWLWREEEQLTCRYVKFELQELLDIAASVVGAQSCAQVLKASEGQYNKVFLLTMDNGREIIAKLPNPNAGRPHFTTASEVATMDFLRNVLNLPVLRVYAWCSRATNNPVGAEYILMEKQPGVMLSDLVLQVVDFEKTLATTKFTGFGSFGRKIENTNFAIGPTNHRAFCDFGRGSLEIDRGPWASAIEFATAVAKREIASVKGGLKYPLMPEGLFYGPRQYQPMASKKLSALHNYLKVATYTLPENSISHASVLWHGDLNLQNIFVDPKEPTRILGIIDWQSVSLCPLFTQATRPAFLEYDGPLPETLDKVRLPENFESLSPAEQQKAKALHQAQTLHNLYLARSRQANPLVFEAIQSQKTLRHQISVIPGLTIMDYEPCLNNLLRDIQKEWPSIVGPESDGASSIPCPLQFSPDEVQEQERDEELWAQGVRLMEEFTSDTGCFKHWDGRVNEQDYELSRKQLDDGVERFLQREARSEEERREWLEALPFVD